MTKVLVVLGAPPAVEGQAQGRTAVGLLRGLLENGVDVRACAARRPNASQAPQPPDLPVEVIDVDAPKPGWSTRVAKLTRPQGHLGRGRFADRVLEAAATVDIVHLEEVHTAVLAPKLETPSIVHLHYLDRKDRATPPPWQPDVIPYLEFLLAERRAARSTPFLAASSPVVAQYLRRVAPHADLTLAPLSLDPLAYEMADHEGPPVAGMIGTAWWPPTRSAIDRLLGSVWPLTHDRYPEATLLIAGRGTEFARPMVSVPRVEVVGEVDSASTFIASLSVFLYPVTRGSGMKVKVLEALACGVPIVTTPEGADGIGAHDGVIVETTDKRLAEAAADLLEDRAARRERGAAARRLFLERFSPGVATRPLVAAYERMVERGRSR